MSERFIKFIPSDEMRFLLRNFPNAFILLTCIAERARQENGYPDGLIIGDALIGSADLEPGLSRQNFRTAINKLVELKHVEIIANGKSFLKRQKSTIKVTIKGLLVNLISTTIYNINTNQTNQRANQRLTNDQPTANHKQERIDTTSKDVVKKEIAQPAAPLHSKDSLTFNFNIWQFEGIQDQDRLDWKKLYPHIEQDLELTKCVNWLKSNPSKNKKTLWRKFLTGWFQKANDTLENKKAFRSATNAAFPDRRTKDIHGNPVTSPYDGKF